MKANRAMIAANLERHWGLSPSYLTRGSLPFPKTQVLLCGQKLADIETYNQYQPTTSVRLRLSVGLRFASPAAIPAAPMVKTRGVTGAEAATRANGRIGASSNAARTSLRVKSEQPPKAA
jgi:hypothetical protein